MTELRAFSAIRNEDMMKSRRIAIARKDHDRDFIHLAGDVTLFALYPCMLYICSLYASMLPLSVDVLILCCQKSSLNLLGSIISNLTMKQIRRFCLST